MGAAIAAASALRPALLAALSEPAATAAGFGCCAGLAVLAAGLVVLAAGSAAGGSAACAATGAPAMGCCTVEQRLMSLLWPEASLPCESDPSSSAAGAGCGGSAEDGAAVEGGAAASLPAPPSETRAALLGAAAAPFWAACLVRVRGKGWG